MDPKDLEMMRKVLDDALKARESNEKFAASIGPVIIDALQPIFKKLNDSSRLTKEEILYAVSQIKIEIPAISVPEAVVHVEIPEIVVPKPEVTVNVPEIKLPEIKIPEINVPAPEVTVNTTPQDLTPIIEAIKSLIPKEKDDMPLLSAIADLMTAIQKPRTDVMKLDDMQLRELSNRGGGGGVIGSAPSTNGVLYDGRKVVAVSSTAIALSSTSKQCEELFITALTTNTDVIVIGGPGVIFTEGTRTGRSMNPGDSIVLKIHDLNKVYLNGTSGDGVAFAYTA